MTVVALALEKRIAEPDDAVAVDEGDRESRDPVLAHLRRVADEPDLSRTRYQMVRFIGRGAMGTVYRAWQPSMERDVALKVLPASALASASLLSRLPDDIRARLEAESDVVEVAIVGGGVIGAGWGARFLLNGIDVAVFDLDPEVERKTLEVVGNALDLP